MLSGRRPDNTSDTRPIEAPSNDDHDTGNQFLPNWEQEPLQPLTCGDRTGSAATTAPGLNGSTPISFIEFHE